MGPVKLKFGNLPPIAHGIYSKLHAIPSIVKLILFLFFCVQETSTTKTSVLSLYLNHHWHNETIRVVEYMQTRRMEWSKIARLSFHLCPELSQLVRHPVMWAGWSNAQKGENSLCIHSNTHCVSASVGLVFFLLNNEADRVVLISFI